MSKGWMIPAIRASPLRTGQLMHILTIRSKADCHGSDHWAHTMNASRSPVPLPPITLATPTLPLKQESPHSLPLLRLSKARPHNGPATKADRTTISHPHKHKVGVAKIMDPAGVVRKDLDPGKLDFVLLVSMK